MIRTLLRVGGLAALCSACVSTSLPDEGRCGALVIEDVSIVDPEANATRSGQSILLQDGVITRIYDAPSASLGITAKRVDASGLYASPALIDAHVHIFDARDIEMHRLHGVAAIRNMDGWAWHLRLAQKKQSPCAISGFITTGSQHEANGEEAANVVARDIIAEKSAGYDWVKLYDSIDETALKVLAKLKTQDPGIRISGHLPDDLPASGLVQSGVYDDIAHAEELLAAMRYEYGADWREYIPEIAEAMTKHGVSLTTSIETNQSIAEQAKDTDEALAARDVQFAAPLLQAFWRSAFNPYGHIDEEIATRLQKDVSALKELVFGLSRQGVTIWAGTDAPNPINVPGAALHAELSRLVEAGLSPAEALQSAFSRPAEGLFPNARLGKIAEEMAGEFILTRENPLNNVDTLRAPAGLVSAGRYLSADEIDQRKQKLASVYAADLEVIEKFSPASAANILNAIETDESGSANISEDGLTSLVWFYMKMNNFSEARTLSEKLAALYPDSADAQFVLGYIISLEDELAAD
ncbi:hypothetical protein PUV54_06230 [Hyphococcus flavus]|uniref:Amidohydrolase-related domain-containing protein n=1 Tax=Hyphococcus flavus TaxID=1866326 RepID=A0AAE9ZGV6_9PROT|nr:hypothetical protein [Hyphococcus flavus]WDI32793.1 hypothetical protein PUV54_06230 [Hyphococcus flavus]